MPLSRTDDTHPMALIHTFEDAGQNRPVGGGLGVQRGSVEGPGDGGQGRACGCEIGEGGGHRRVAGGRTGGAGRGGLGWGGQSEDVQAEEVVEERGVVGLLHG